MFSLKFCGAWIRKKDGLLTDDKERAVVFNTVDEAYAYAIDWKNTTTVHIDNKHKIQIVEVACKLVISKVGLVHQEIEI